MRRADDVGQALRVRLECSIRTPDCRASDCEEPSSFEQLVGLVTICAQTVVPDALLAENRHRVATPVAGLQIGHHAKEGKFAIFEDVDPADGEHPDVELEQVRVGGLGNGIADRVADRPAPGLVQQAETVVAAGGTRDR